MSGGHFDYEQYKIEDIASKIQGAIDEWGIADEWGYIVNENYPSDKTKKEFIKAVKMLREARVYAQRIDWLISGDDGEESFHERLKEDLLKLKTK